jgi:hypothetical protein
MRRRSWGHPRFHAGRAIYFGARSRVGRRAGERRRHRWLRNRRAGRQRSGCHRSGLSRSRGFRRGDRGRYGSSNPTLSISVVRGYQGHRCDTCKERDDASRDHAAQRLACIRRLGGLSLQRQNPRVHWGFLDRLLVPVEEIERERLAAFVTVRGGAVVDRLAMLAGLEMQRSAAGVAEPGAGGIAMVTAKTEQRDQERHLGVVNRAPVRRAGASGRSSDQQLGTRRDLFASTRRRGWLIAKPGRK